MVVTAVAAMVGLSAVVDLADTITVNATGSTLLDRPNILTAVQQCNQTGKTLVLVRTANTPFRLDQPLIVQPDSFGGAIKLNIKGISPGLMPLVQYLGPDGTSCFVTRGLKFSTWTDVSVQIGNKSTTAFSVTTYGAFQSSSYVTFDHCKVLIQGVGGKGWQVGPDGAGAADISGIAWRACSVSGGGIGRFGWGLTGGNTLGLAWYDCSADNLTEHAWQFWQNADVNPSYAGGSTSSLYNCGAGSGLGFVKMQGGFEVGVYSGRSEKLSGPVFWAGAGSGVGYLNVFGHKTGSCPTFSQVDGATPVNTYP